MTRLYKTKKRVKNLGEVYTHQYLIIEILNDMPPDAWLPGKTYFEPACGTGNFIVEILNKKIKHGHGILNSLSSIYGIDIMKDNIDECRKRMFTICINNGLKKNDWPKAINIIKRNIIVGNTLDLDIDKLWND